MRLALALMLLAWAASVEPAALLNLGGARIIVMTAEEFEQAMALQLAEIERLKAERKKDCGLI